MATNSVWIVDVGRPGEWRPLLGECWENEDEAREMNAHIVANNHNLALHEYVRKEG